MIEVPKPAIAAKKRKNGKDNRKGNDYSNRSRNDNIKTPVKTKESNKSTNKRIAIIFGEMTTGKMIERI